jgi:hypothetical protein
LLREYRRHNLKEKIEEKNAPVVVAPPVKKKPETGIKEYDKVITKEAVSDEGLFTVHRVDKKYYFEILITY